MQSLLQFSVLIEGDHEKPIAVADADISSGLSRDEAIEIRGLMLQWGLPEHIPYVLLLSKDTGFLWKDKPSLSADSPPDLEFPMDSVITRYASRKREELDQYLLGWTAFKWLWHLSVNPEDRADQPEEMLAHAGFLDAIKDALVVKGDPW